MESTATASDKPKKSTAALLAILAPFVGMLYVARPGWAAVYFAVAIILAMGNILLFHGAQTVTDVAMLLLAVVCSVHAYRLARDFEDSRTRPWYSRWYGLAGVVTALAVPIFGTRAFFFEPFRFPSGSMEPSIEPPAHLIVKKWGYGNYGTYGIHVARTGISSQVRRGDIIVFEYPEDPSISYAKRVVGLPGDRVSYFNKQLKVNEKDALIKETGEYIHRRGLFHFWTDVPLLPRASSAGFRTITISSWVITETTVAIAAFGALSQRETSSARFNSSF